MSEDTWFVYIPALACLVWAHVDHWRVRRMILDQDRVITAQRELIYSLESLIEALGPHSKSTAVLRRVERDYAMRCRGESPNPGAAQELLASMRSVLNRIDGITEAVR